MHILRLAVLFFLCNSPLVVAQVLPPCAEEVGAIATATPYRGELRFIQATPDNEARLKISQCMISPNKAYGAVMQSDGNFVVYRTDDMQPIYSIGTQGNNGASLVLTKHGNIEIFELGGVEEKSDSNIMINIAKRVAYSHPRSQLVASYYMAMQDDGNFVIYLGEPSRFINRHTWSSFHGAVNDPSAAMAECTMACPNTADGQQCRKDCKR